MHQHRNAKHGMILLSVLCMVFALSLSTYYFSEKLLNDLEFITAQQAAVARRLAADSGVSYAAALTDAPEWPRLMQQRDRQPFQDILIASPRDDMFCTLVHPLTHRRGPLQLGMLDESSKLNLNALRWDEEYAEESRQRLLSLPGMSPQAADSILDWLDPDHDPRPLGAERNYYQTQQPPRQPANGPLMRLEELLHVRGVEPALLFGEDANGNGWLDANEDDGDLTPPLDNADGRLQSGWSEYLTLTSGESTRRPDGSPKINLNQDDLPALFDELVEAFDEETATFVVGLRLVGPANWKVKQQEKSAQRRLQEQLGQDSDGEPQASESSQRAGMDLSLQPLFQFRSLYDLCGTQIRPPGRGRRQLVSGPWTARIEDLLKEFPKIQQQLTIAGTEGIRGRVNVNTAPVAVLRGVPGLTEEQVQAIVARRQQRRNKPPPATLERPNTLWLVQEGILTWAELRRTGAFLTAQGDIRSFVSLAYERELGPITRVAAVVDSTTYPAQILLRDDQQALPATFRSLLGEVPR